jgi:hypothetical protein
MVLKISEHESYNMSWPLSFCKHKVCKRDKFDIYFSSVCDGTLKTIFLPTDQICQMCISFGGALGHISSFQLSFPGYIYLGRCHISWQSLSICTLQEKDICFSIFLYSSGLSGSPDCFVFMIL